MSEQNQMNQNWNQNNQQVPQGGGQPMPNQGNPQWNYQGQNTASYQQPSQGYQPADGSPMEASYQNYANNQRYAQSLPNGNQPPKKKSKVGLVVAFAVVAVLLLGLGGMYAMGMFAGKTNVDKLLEAFLQTSNTKQVEVYNEIGIDELTVPKSAGGMFDETIMDLFRGAALKIHSKGDSENLRYDVDMRLNLKDLEVLDIIFHQMGKDQIVSIPKLFSGSVYFSENSLDDQLGELQEVDKIMDSFRPEAIEKAAVYLKPAFNPTTLKSFKALEKKKYLGRIKDRYNKLIKVEKGSKVVNINGTDHEIKADFYEFTENLGDFSEFYYGLVLELTQDENFKPFVTEYLERLISTAEANKDVVVYNYLTLINGSNDFKDEWDEDVKSQLIYYKEVILDGIDQFAEELKRPSVADGTAKAFAAFKESGSEITVVYGVDKIIKYSDARVKMNLKKVAEILGEGMEGDDMFETIAYHVTSAVLATGNDVKFDEFDKSSALDYANASQEDLERLMSEIQGNLMQIIFSLGIF